MLKFAFELRKIDLLEKYTFPLLSGNVDPPILVDLAMSNKWNKYANKMEIENGKKFVLKLAMSEYCLKQQKKFSSNL